MLQPENRFPVKLGQRKKREKSESDSRAKEANE